jgi:hypothetical protein
MNRRSHIPTARTLLLAAAFALCVTSALAQDSAAKVIQQVGQVSISDGGYFKALSVGDTIRIKQLIITGPDGYARFEVQSDKSTFEVFPNSKVYFRDVPGAWDNLLNVVFGRIKVFIQHAPGIPNPNKVYSPTAVISVRGTVFDVVVEDADGTTFVTVDEGIVDVRNMSAPGPSVTLRKDESIRVYPGQPLVARQVDKGNLMRRFLYVAREGLWQVMIGRGPGGGNGPIAGPTGGAQGDRGKDTTTAGPGAPTTGPGPGAPPAGPGGQ